MKQHRGLAPVLPDSQTPYPLLPHPPPSPGRLPPRPKPYQSPVSFSVVGRPGPGGPITSTVHTLILTPAVFFTRPFCSAATLHLGRYSGFFCDLQISRAFPLSLAGRCIRQTSRRLASSSSPVVHLAPRTQSQLDAGLTSPRLFLLHGATSPHSGLSSTTLGSSRPTSYQPAPHLTPADQDLESQHPSFKEHPQRTKEGRENESAP